MNARKAFSYPELLVTAGLVALLSLIAAHARREAQRDALVAQAYTDLREIKAAVEVYALEWNDFPRQTWGCPPYESTINGELAWGTLPAAMTSPVAYLTELKEDVFAPASAAGPDRLYTYLNMDNQYEFTNNGSRCPSQPGYWCYPTPLWVQGVFLGTYGTWGAMSAGPDRDTTNDEWAFHFYLYDPMNGINSAGNIWIGPLRGLEPSAADGWSAYE